LQFGNPPILPIKVNKKEDMMKDLEDYLNKIISQFGNTQCVQEFLKEDEKSNI
jgi:hypothetical protein